MLWWQYILAIWFLSPFVSFYVQTLGYPIIYAGDVLLMICFGPAYLIGLIMLQDIVVWEKKRSK